MATATSGLLNSLLNASIGSGKQQFILLQAAPTGVNIPGFQNVGAGYLVDQNSGPFTITLPLISISVGNWYRFSLINTAAHDISIIGNATDINKLYGSVVVNGVAGATTSFSKGTCKFISGTATAGDVVSAYCDGIGWYLNCITGAAGGITIA